MYLNTFKAERAELITKRLNVDYLHFPGLELFFNAYYPQTEHTGNKLKGHGRVNRK